MTNANNTLLPLNRDPYSWLYPIKNPISSDYLGVGGGHRLYYEVCGAADGKPAVFLHGGPGGGVDESQRCFFNPRLYKTVLFDQRGAGKSTPYASLEKNTTWDLVEDIEALRKHLGVDSWLVFGGSWGSTLALAYAISYPQRVSELVLRGIFLVRPSEIRWFYQGGASAVFPDAWEDFVAPIPPEERNDFVAAYYKRLTSSDMATRLAAARAWSLWEGRTSRLYTPERDTVKYTQDTFAEAFARIECHYFTNKAFFPSDNYILENIDKIRHIPAVIVQGRYDMCCPITSAWDLHRAWPEAEFTVIPDAGHSAFEVGIARALVAATDRFAERYRRQV